MNARLKLIALGMLALAGCETQKSLQTGPDAEVTHDGLVRVDNSTMQYAWIDPEIDLSRYSKIIPMPASFEFRAVRDTGNARRSNQNEFVISDASRAKIEAAVTDVFREELAKSRYFTITDQPAPDALILEAAVLDIVSRVPPDITGRGEIYLDRIGEATLVLQLRDSTSKETLARTADRQAVEPATGGVRASTVTSMSELRRTARRWAMRLREGLDELHETGAIAGN